MVRGRAPRLPLRQVVLLILAGSDEAASIQAGDVDLDAACGQFRLASRRTSTLISSISHPMRSTCRAGARSPQHGRFLVWSQDCSLKLVDDKPARLAHRRRQTRARDPPRFTAMAATGLAESLGVAVPVIERVLYQEAGVSPVRLAFHDLPLAQREGFHGGCAHFVLGGFCKSFAASDSLFRRCRVFAQRREPPPTTAFARAPRRSIAG